MNVLANSSAESAPAPPRARSDQLADVVFDALYAGAIGGSTLALFFLGVDLIHGQPLYTPSLLGAMLFSGAAPHQVTDVRMDMVAYFTVVHFVAFAAFGTLVSLLCRWTGLSGRPTLTVAGVIFLLLSALSFLAATALNRALLSIIGFPWILTGHAFTALAMALFLRWSHQPDEESDIES